jgi:hypothetical protein
MVVQQHQKPRLQVATEGKRHFIQVPRAHGESLLGYLRRCGVHAEPPSPCSNDLDSIQLGTKVQAETVQSLLDRWE